MLKATCRECGSNDIVIGNNPRKSGEEYFENTHYPHDKFWAIRRNHATVYTRYGKNGTDGVTNLREFDSAHDAAEYVGRKIREKEREGYGRAY